MAAHTVLSSISEDEVNWLRQMSEEKKMRDYITGMDAAKRIGMQKGMQKGMKKGVQKGIRQGERKKALETARNAISMGLFPEQISKLTGLSINEIAKLEN